MGRKLVIHIGTNDLGKYRRSGGGIWPGGQVCLYDNGSVTVTSRDKRVGKLDRPFDKTFPDWLKHAGIQVDKIYDDGYPKLSVRSNEQTIRLPLYSSEHPHLYWSRSVYLAINDKTRGMVAFDRNYSELGELIYEEWEELSKNPHIVERWEGYTGCGMEGDAVWFDYRPGK